MSRLVAAENMEDLTLAQIVSKNIRDLMHRSKISSKSLAELVGVAESTITRCTSGKTAPTLDTLADIEVALNTTPDKLLQRSIRDKSLTGVTSIDDLVFDLYKHLWMQPEIANRVIGHRIHSDYQLFYCDANTREAALGPGWKEELQANAKHPYKVETLIHSAAILSDTSIMVHVSSVALNTFIQNDLPRSMKHDRIAKTEIIEVWQLTHSIDEIRAKKDLKWQILSRSIKILREMQEI